MYLQLWKKLIGCGGGLEIRIPSAIIVLNDFELFFTIQWIDLFSFSIQPGIYFEKTKRLFVGGTEEHT